MQTFLKALWAATRTSEFWVAVWQTFIEVTNVPPPEVPGLEGSALMVKVFSWVYVAYRVLSKAVQFVIPNPAAGASAGWLKSD